MITIDQRSLLEKMLERLDKVSNITVPISEIAIQTLARQEMVRIIKSYLHETEELSEDSR